ncbi:MAG: sensor domain-containing diguanylate cyclase [Armatimonadetes bacterium]|nr:sensor domain-containing diguanylate cyclase [Armatimonadota bacterium]
MPEQGLINLAPLRTALQQLEKQIVGLQDQSGDLERRSRLASAMLDATRQISSSLSLSEVISQILDSTQTLLGARRSSIMLMDPGTQQLHVIGSRGIDPETVKNLRFKPEEGIAGNVLATGKPVVVADVSTDRRFVLRHGHKLKPEAMACVPLTDPKGVLGVLSIDKPLTDCGSLGSDELAYLTFLADHAAVALKNARLHEDLHHRVAQLSTLYEVGSALTSVLNVDRLLGKIIEGVVQVTGAQICSLMLLESSGRYLRVRVAQGLSPTMIKKIAIPVGEGISGHVAKTGEPLLISDIERHPQFKRRSLKKYSSNSLLTVPLKIKGKTIGVLNVNNKQPTGVFTPDDQNLLSLFANQAAVMIENANLYQNMERLATTDGLTGLFVHRYFQESLDDELRRAKRYQRPLSVLMMDIDHFKRLNDTYGHQAGDHVLREMAQILNRVGRQGHDIIARYGGEEFIIALVETPKRGALRAAERFRSAVEACQWVHKNKPIQVTVSVGVSNYPLDTDTRESLIRMADEALYLAKESGRNRVGYFDKTGNKRLLKTAAQTSADKAAKSAG